MSPLPVLNVCLSSLLPPPQSNGDTHVRQSGCDCSTCKSPSGADASGGTREASCLLLLLQLSVTLCGASCKTCEEESAWCLFLTQVSEKPRHVERLPRGCSVLSTEDFRILPLLMSKTCSPEMKLEKCTLAKHKAVCICVALPHLHVYLHFQYVEQVSAVTPRGVCLPASPGSPRFSRHHGCSSCTPSVCEVTSKWRRHGLSCHGKTTAVSFQWCRWGVHRDVLWLPCGVRPAFSALTLVGSAHKGGDTLDLKVIELSRDWYALLI